MILNKVETKIMLKAKSALEDMFNNGNLNKYGVVPYTAKEVATCYDELIHNETHSTKTLCLEVKTFFNKLGFLVEESENKCYWNIYISERAKKLLRNN